jgi:hypothetical protein
MGAQKHAAGAQKVLRKNNELIIEILRHAQIGFLRT